MIIIIEGPDGSGKSTLAEQLSRQTKYPVIHRVQPKTDEDKLGMLLSYQEAIRKGRNVIFDRAWYSELVYGPIFRDASVLTYGMMYELERQAAKHGAIIIYCTDKPDVLWRRCKARGEDYVQDLNTLKNICGSFDDIMSMPHLVPVVRYAYKDV